MSSSNCGGGASRRSRPHRRRCATRTLDALSTSCAATSEAFRSRPPLERATADRRWQYHAGSGNVGTCRARCATRPVAIVSKRRGTLTMNAELHYYATPGRTTELDRYDKFVADLPADPVRLSEIV